MVWVELLPGTISISNLLPSESVALTAHQVGEQRERGAQRAMFGGRVWGKCVGQKQRAQSPFDNERACVSAATTFDALRVRPQEDAGQMARQDLACAGGGRGIRLPWRGPALS